MEKLKTKDIPCLRIYYTWGHYAIRICPHINQLKELPEEIIVWPGIQLMTCNRCGVMISEHTNDSSFLTGYVSEWKEICACGVEEFDPTDIVVLDENEKVSGHLKKEEENKQEEKFSELKNLIEDLIATTIYHNDKLDKRLAFIDFKCRVLAGAFDYIKKRLREDGDSRSGFTDSKCKIEENKRRKGN